MRDSASGMVAAEVLPDVTMSRATIAFGQRRCGLAIGVDDAQVGLVRDERREVLEARRPARSHASSATGAICAVAQR